MPVFMIHINYSAFVSNLVNQYDVPVDAIIRELADQAGVFPKALKALMKRPGGIVFDEALTPFRTELESLLGRLPDVGHVLRRNV